MTVAARSRLPRELTGNDVVYASSLGRDYCADCHALEPQRPAARASARLAVKTS